jgi:drug/metabolite transporter (DMT)-like permease
MVLALIPTWGASSLLSPLVLALAGTALWVERRMWQAWVGLACGVLGVAGIFEFVAVNF